MNMKMRLTIEREDIEELAALCRAESLRCTAEMVCADGKYSRKEMEAINRRERACRHLLAAIMDADREAIRARDRAAGERYRREKAALG